MFYIASFYFYSKFSITGRQVIERKYFFANKAYRFSCYGGGYIIQRKQSPIMVLNRLQTILLRYKHGQTSCNLIKSSSFSNR